MADLTRRRLFGLTAAVMASTAVPALMWHASPLNIDHISAAIIAKLDAQWDEPDMRWSAQEVEDHKARGGWPEYA